MALSERQQRLKDDYIRDRGYWVSFNDGLLVHSPDFLEAYLRFAALPARTGPLSAKVRELIYVAIDASTTHLFEAGLRVHVGIALKSGCTPTELIEALQIATAQGLDSVNQGVEVLAETLAAAGRSPAALTSPETPQQATLRQAYVARHGDWPRHCDLLLRLSPEFFAAMLELLNAPDKTGALDDKTRALIACALAASPTHLNRDALRLHMQRALRAGASEAELLEVLQLTTHLGVHACVLGVPMIVEAGEADRT